MNKAMYGILAAALLAASKSKRGGWNTGGNLRSGLKSLLKNQRKDVALSTIYSFINLEEVEESLELSSISNVNLPIDYSLQPILFLALTEEDEIDALVDSIYKTIITSFEDKPELAEIAWKKSSAQLVEAYNNFFKSHDFGIAYSYIASSVYPKNINNEDWFKLFKDSTTPALGLVYTQALSGKPPDVIKQYNEQFLSAWLKSQISPNEFGDMFDASEQTELLEIKNIFSNAGDIFYYLATSENIRNLPVKEYPVQFIHQLLEKEHGASDFNSSHNFFMLDMVINSLAWLKSRLSSIKDTGNSFKYPESEIDTYGKLWEFWDHPTRVGSQPMIFVEMDHFRSNKMTSSVPNAYKQDKRIITVIME